MAEDMALAFGPYWAWKAIAVLLSPVVLAGTWSEIWRARERRRQSGPHPSAFHCTSILADVAAIRSGSRIGSTGTSTKFLTTNGKA